MKIQLVHKYEDIISLENLLGAWQEFVVGKKSKPDVQEFSRNLMDRIVELHQDLVNRSYRHGGYHSFFINDPKRRHIHKASVCDRLVHHAVYRVLYPFFERTFIANSFSCREEKGVHKALDHFRRMVYSVSRNNTKTCWILKCDIKQYFASINHDVLFSILTSYIPDPLILSLLKDIIGSFRTTPERAVGLPLGNLTSQLLTNVYMNTFDQWVKHALKAYHYIRYADDFVFLSLDRARLQVYLPLLQQFLSEKLHLTVHPQKIILKSIASGVDFLGWTHFFNHRVLRGVTKSRMLRRVQQRARPETFQSYLGLLRHGNTKKIQDEMLSHYWLFSSGE